MVSKAEISARLQHCLMQTLRLNYNKQKVPIHCDCDNEYNKTIIAM